MPVNAGRLRQVVIKDDADSVSLVRLNRWTRRAAVKAIPRGTPVLRKGQGRSFAELKVERLPLAACADLARPNGETGKKLAAQPGWGCPCFLSRTLDPIHFRKHRRRKSAPGQIANRPLAGVINLCEFPSATGTLQPSVPSFAPYPQLQRLRLLVDLVLIDPIPGPVQNPGELAIRRQSAILAAISKPGPSHSFLLRGVKCY
jgi:hypothetical protein